MFDEREPAEELLTINELIVKVRESLNTTIKERKKFARQGDKEMETYAEGWQNALVFILANTDPEWWKSTEKLNS
jgi:hypothetical protein